MNPKHAFWQAFFVTIIIFCIGIIIGFFIEGFRSDKIQDNLISSEINLLDQQLKDRVFVNFNVTCEDSVNSTFRFADKIYGEARQLEKYDESSKFTDSIFLLHKRYDLLRVMLWTESIELKNRCNFNSNTNFYTIVYLYEYNVDDVDQVSEQTFFSRVLFELKSKYPDKILLIPIAVDMDLESVDLAVSDYNIESYPVIIINEGKIVENIESLEELEKEVFKK
ncbi:MAG TPA: hypothetical protein VI815_03925 [Candidatus Nanoarchaeia archaeon]|nr:hypothetical protein [Candidatus Nanoarchaeia archaeon]